jgi:membrane protease YdiL (CAAX protease family)
VGLIRRYPLSAYVILAYLLSIGIGLLLNVSILFGLIALFGPAVAALVVSWAWRGRSGLAELRTATTRWRVGPSWYVAALGLPIVGFALGHALFVATGHDAIPVPGAVEPVLFILFILVIGEEIGWRGFLLRVLLQRRSPIVATAIVAVIWALWHSPLYFLPGMPSYGQPFLAFAAWVIPLSFLLTWLWIGTRSAWLTTLMHGSANIAAALVFPQADAGTLFTYAAAGTAVVAVVLVARSWTSWIAVTDPHAAPEGLADLAVQQAGP